MITSKQVLAGLVVGLVSIFDMTAAADEITPYGAFNYKFSHDENSSGVAYNKLQDNGSKIGIDFTESSIDGSSLGSFAKL